MGILENVSTADFISSSLLEWNIEAVVAAMSIFCLSSSTFALSLMISVSCDLILARSFWFYARISSY